MCVIYRNRAESAAHIAPVWRAKSWDIQAKEAGAQISIAEPYSPCRRPSMPALGQTELRATFGC